MALSLESQRREVPGIAAPKNPGETRASSNPRPVQDGKSRREAVRALKRHLASAVYRAMRSMAATSSLEVTAAPAVA